MLTPKDKYFNVLKSLDKLSNLIEQFRHETYKFDNMHWVFKTILYLPIGLMIQNKYLRNMKNINAQMSQLNKELNNLNKQSIWTKQI